jgi:acyl dehydratase
MNNITQPQSWNFDEIKIGYKTEPILCIFTPGDIDEFARISGDYNPLHLSDAFAQHKGFQGRVVHGMLLASKLSYLVGMVLPGTDSLYLTQELNFRRPIVADEQCILTGIVMNKSASTRIVEIKIELVDLKGGVALDGLARVKVL